MTAASSSAIIDPVSGLFTEAFLRATLPTRVATARRAMKQLGLVFVEVVATGEPGAAPPGDDVPSRVGAVVRDTLRDSDTGVVLDDGRYALLLEFTPVDGCIVISRRLSDRLTRDHPDLTMQLGVASYPVHAIDANELLAAADRAARTAADHEPGSLAVAPVAD